MEHLKNMTASHIIILKHLSQSTNPVFSHVLMEKLYQAIPEITENFIYRQIQKLAALGLLKIIRPKKKGPENLITSTPSGQECYHQLMQYLSKNPS